MSEPGLSAEEEAQLRGKVMAAALLFEVAQAELLKALAAYQQALREELEQRERWLEQAAADAEFQRAVEELTSRASSTVH